MTLFPAIPAATFSGVGYRLVKYCRVDVFVSKVAARVPPSWRSSGRTGTSSGLTESRLKSSKTASARSGRVSPGGGLGTRSSSECSIHAVWGGSECDAAAETRVLASAMALLISVLSCFCGERLGRKAVVCAACVRCDAPTVCLHGCLMWPIVCAEQPLGGGAGICLACCCVFEHRLATELHVRLSYRALSVARGCW